MNPYVFMNVDSVDLSPFSSFAGVIFALKVLTHQMESSAPGSWTYMSGLAVPARWAVWAELVLIHVLAPGTSFIGHLAGILVGLAYTYGPLEYAVNCLDKMITGEWGSCGPGLGLAEERSRYQAIRRFSLPVLHLTAISCNSRVIWAQLLPDLSTPRPRRLAPN